MPLHHAGPHAISYADEGSGPPAVLLHSGGLSARQWARLSARLRGIRRVIAPDLIGYAASSPWPAGTPFHFDEDTRAVESLLASIGGPFDLIGHSYGGLIALRVALQRPSDVRSIALFEPVAFGVLYSPPDDEAIRDLGDLDRDAGFSDDAAGGGEAWLERFVDWWNGPGAWRALPEPSRDGFRQVGRKVFLEASTLVRDRTPAADYGAISAPALLLSGARSPLAARRVAARLAAAMPRGVAVTIEGAGHMGPMTHAADVNERIVAHVAGAG